MGRLIIMLASSILSMTLKSQVLPFFYGTVLYCVLVLQALCKDVTYNLNLALLSLPPPPSLLISPSPSLSLLSLISTRLCCSQCPWPTRPLNHATTSSFCEPSSGLSVEVATSSSIRNSYLFSLTYCKVGGQLCMPLGFRV